MKLISILSGKGFVMYNKELAHSVSVNGSIIFGQLCSSYESFEAKGMLTVKSGKKYFFLTSETLEEETALTYKQQLKATKELEKVGYIETITMGMPSKKYFHITNKIVKELIGIASSDKREDLDTNSNPSAEGQKVTPRYDEREYQALTKSNGMHEQKVTLKINNKNKKEKDKNNNFNCNYKKLDINEFRNLLINACNKQYTKFSIGRYSKKQWNTLIEKFVNDTIESGRYKNVSRDKIDGFAFKCLERIVDHNNYKNSDEFVEYQEVMRDLVNTNRSNSNPHFYNWLED